MLRGGDAAVAVNAVADAAASRGGVRANGSRGRGWRRCAREVLRGGSGRGELLRAAAALLNGGGAAGAGRGEAVPDGYVLAPLALRRLCKPRSAPGVAVEDVSRWTEAAAREPTWIDVNSSHPSAHSSTRGDADRTRTAHSATVAARDWVAHPAHLARGARGWGGRDGH